MDLNIYNLYGEEMQKYFDHHKLELKIHKTMIGEKAKSMDTLLSIVDSMTDFGIIRKEPVLVVVCCRRSDCSEPSLTVCREEAS
jgi:3-dehydroquinate synthase